MQGISRYGMVTKEQWTLGHLTLLAPDAPIAARSQRAHALSGCPVAKDLSRTRCAGEANRWARSQKVKSEIGSERDWKSWQHTSINTFSSPIIGTSR
jgi:hypothetical protein